MSFVLIIVALSVGLGMQRLPVPQARLLAVLNRYIFWLALPGLMFKHLTGLSFEWQYLWLASVSWLSFSLAWVWVLWLRARFDLDRQTTGCLVLTLGLGNTGFVGYPLLQGLYGPEVLADAIILDQLGTFFLLSTLAIVVGAAYSGKSPRKRDMAMRIGRFPPCWCFLLVALMNWLDWHWSSGLDQFWGLLGSTLIPVALVIVGLQLSLGAFAEFKKLLAWGLGYRLLLSPLVIWLLYSQVFSGQTLGVAVLEAGMAPMVSAAILASSMGLNPRLSGALVSLGTALSFVTVPLWYLLLQL